MIPADPDPARSRDAAGGFGAKEREAGGSGGATQMNDGPQPTGEEVLAFLERLEPVGDLLLALTDGEPVGVTVEVRGSGRKVLLDLGAGDEGTGSLRVVQGGAGLEGDIGIAATAGDLHRNFLGRLGIMTGIAERRLLLRGGMCRLVKFFPVLELVPVLYAEYCDARGGQGRARRPGPLRRGLGRVLGACVAAFAWCAGRLLRGRGRRELLVPLRAVARGAARFHPKAKGPPRRRGRKPARTGRQVEAVGDAAGSTAGPAPAAGGAVVPGASPGTSAAMVPVSETGSAAAPSTRDALGPEPGEGFGRAPNPLDPPRPGWGRRMWLGGLAGVMAATGWWVSLLKHKLGVPIDLFRVLGAMSRGLRTR